MFSGMYDMPDVQDGRVEKVDDELILDLYPTDSDLFIGDSTIQQVQDKVIDLEADADWLEDPASLMVVARDSPGAENVVQYTEEEEADHRDVVSSRVASLRNLLLTKCGLEAVASDRACAEVEAVLRDVYNMNVTMVNCTPEFASLVTDVEIFAALAAAAPNLSVEVRDAMVKRVAEISIDEMFAQRKAAARAKTMKQLIQKNNGLVGGDVGSSAVLATLSDRKRNG